VPGKATITKAHIDLLHRFGQSALQRRLPSTKKEELWRLTCQTGGVAEVSFEDVVDEWRRSVTGDSSHTSLAIGSTVDPDYATIAVCYREKSIGAHTVKVRAVLTRVLMLYKASFDSPEQFVSAVKKITERVATKKEKRGKKR